MRVKNIKHPIIHAEVSADYDHYEEVRDYADTLVGTSYWEACESLGIQGFECEHSFLEDSREGEMVVNYVKFCPEDEDNRVAAIFLTVDVKSR